MEMRITVIHDFSSLVDVIPKLMSQLAAMKSIRGAVGEQNPAASPTAGDSPAAAPASATAALASAASASPNQAPADSPAPRRGRKSNAQKAAEAAAAAQMAPVAPAAPPAAVPGFGAAAPAPATPPLATQGVIPGFDAPTPPPAAAPTEANAPVSADEVKRFQDYVIQLSQQGKEAIYLQVRAKFGNPILKSLTRGQFDAFKAEVEKLAA